MNTTEKNGLLLKASLAYFGTSIMTAIVLDTMRIKMLEPLWGKSRAAMMEIPVLLAICWNVSLWSTAKYNVPKKLDHRLVMGTIAFLLFFLVELCMTVFVRGMTLGEAVKNYPTSFLENFPANLIGRLGEIVYGLIPLIQMIRGEERQTTGGNVKLQ